MADRRERWHVGKEIPLAVVVTMILQAAAIVWFAAIAEQNVVNARLDVTLQNVNRTLESVSRHMEASSGR